LPRMTRAKNVIAFRYNYQLAIWIPFMEGFGFRCGNGGIYTALHNQIGNIYLCRRPFQGVTLKVCHKILVELKIVRKFLFCSAIFYISDPRFLPFIKLGGVFVKPAS